jgi:hypothetical protein
MASAAVERYGVLGVLDPVAQLGIVGVGGARLAAGESVIIRC